MAKETPTMKEVRWVARKAALLMGMSEKQADVVEDYATTEPHRSYICYVAILNSFGQRS